MKNLLGTALITLFASTNAMGLEADYPGKTDSGKYCTVEVKTDGDNRLQELAVVVENYTSLFNLTIEPVRYVTRTVHTDVDGYVESIDFYNSHRDLTTVYTIGENQVSLLVTQSGETHWDETCVIDETLKVQSY